MKRLLILCLLVVTLEACEKEIMTASEVFTPSAFNEIELIDGFDVLLVEDSTWSLEVLGDEKMITRVEWQVVDSVLVIDNLWKNKIFTPRKNHLELVIKSPALRKLTAAEGCSIRTLNPITTREFGLVLGGKVAEADLELDGEVFFYWNNFPCGGKLTLSGRTDVLKILNCAIMSVDASNLQSRFAIVRNNSHGDCMVRVSERLEYSIQGIGNIEVYGNPQEVIALTDSSMGRLIRR